MVRIVSALLLLVLLSGCVLPGAPRPTSGTPTPDRRRALSPTHTSPASVSRPSSGQSLAALRANIHRAYAGNPLSAWKPATYAASLDELPVNLLDVGNFGVITGLTYEQQYFLGLNGFVVAGTQEEQFYQIRDQVSKVNGQPYYLTTDAAYYALDLTLDVLLPAFERERLLPELSAIVGATLNETLSALDAVGGTALEADAHTAAAYLAVAMRLLDPDAVIDLRLEPGVTRQVEQILAAGRGESVLIPAYSDDFAAYAPSESVTGHPELAALFRARTWFERAALQPGRAPLILTMALRRARVNNEEAVQAWSRLYETAAFLYGARPGYSPVDYAAMMDQVYGSRLAYADLADEELWSAFLARASQPAPDDPALPGLIPPDNTWRFLPAPFSLERSVLGERPDSAVGLMAVLGSPAAHWVLGTVSHPDAETLVDETPEPVPTSETELSGPPDSAWLHRLNHAWLYAFQSQGSLKGEAYPPYMRTTAWASRDLTASLAAWARWQNTSIPEVIVPEPKTSPAPPASGPAPAYVEPNPEVFYRLAYIAQALVDGLRVRGYTAGPNQFLMAQPGPMTFDQALYGLSDLAKKLQQLGGVASRELQGIDPSDDERYLIQSCLGPVECTVLKAIEYGETAQMPPVPAVAVVSGAGQNGLFHVGTGQVDRIYVAVPLDGRLQVAQGGVFSYYEFDRERVYLNDEWVRRQLANPMEQPAWTGGYRYPGGAPADALAIHKGDVLLVTDLGEGLNLRGGPSTSDEVLQQLMRGDLITVQGGPVEADGYTWWYVRLEYSRSTTGWLVEDPVWYSRVY